MSCQSLESDSNNCWRLLRQGCSRVWRRDVCPCVPTRYVLALVSCLGFINVYILRVNLSVAIVQMDATTASVTNTSARTFEWTSQEEGWILSSFFFGYLITQIPGGWMAERYGGRWVFGIGIIMTAVFTLFTPLAAYWHIGALIAVRVAEGIFEGVTFPAMHAIWAKWAPPAERSILTTISYSGCHIGSIISFTLSALLCRYGFDGGWPSVFYVFGTIGILWFFLWLFVGYSSPASHPRISARERAHIEGSLAEQGTKEQIPIPWLHILISPAVWAIIIAHFCDNWGFSTLLTCMPTYFKQAIHSLQIGGRTDSVVLSGVYSTFPYILMVSLLLSGGFLADWMRKKIHTTTVRKIMTLVSFILCGSFLLLCGYLGTTTATAVTFLTIAVGSRGLCLSGFGCNHLDIAPRYAGVLMGLANAIATISAIIGPYIAKAIAHKPLAAEGTSAYLEAYRKEWQEVFIISIELYAFGSIVYLFLASGEKQYWADGWPPRSHRGDAAETPVVSKDSAGLEPPSEKTKLLIQNQSDEYVLVNYK